VMFAGTEFTTSGLVNTDTVTSVTLTSTGGQSRPRSQVRLTASRLAVR
jgi:hypothetical protein